MKRAQLIAEAVAVVCPYCGECQPNCRDGSHLWLPEDFDLFHHHKGSKMDCVSCDKQLLIGHDTKVQFPVPEKTI